MTLNKNLLIYFERFKLPESFVTVSSVRSLGIMLDLFCRLPRGKEKEREKRKWERKKEDRKIET